MTGKTIKPEKSQIGDKIMLALLVAFVLPAMLTSPFGLYAIAYGGARRYFKRYEFHRTVKRLEKKGYIALTKTEKGWVVKLLKKGKLYASQIEFEKLTLPRPKKWDGKWRLFSFDIPEEFRNARNMMRRKIKALGCYNIQRSLFVYPYDCMKELQQVADHYKVGKYTVFGEVTYIDVDKQLRKFFNL
ncbi:MAG: hypothetical protein Q8P83_03750 [bacterium]|nr:hypothetical protein [bacterium]